MGPERRVANDNELVVGVERDAVDVWVWDDARVQVGTAEQARTSRRAVHSPVLGARRHIKHASRAGEPGGQGGRMTHGNLPSLGGQTSYLDPKIFLEKKIFWYTPTRKLHHNYIIF